MISTRLLLLVLIALILPTIVLVGMHTWGEQAMSYSRNTQGISIEKINRDNTNTRTTSQHERQHVPSTETTANVDKNNQLAPSSPEEQTTLQQHNKGSSLTQDLYNLILLTKQSTSTPLNTNSINSKVITTFFEQNNIQEYIQSFPHYTNTDISTENTINRETIKRYSSSITRAFYSHLPKHSTDDEYALFKKAQQATTPEARQLYSNQLQIAGDRYRNILHDLLEIPVPRDAIEKHLALINSLSLIITRIEGMQNLYTEPVRAIIDAGAYRGQIPALVRSYNALGAYFENHNVEFSTPQNTTL